MMHDPAYIKELFSRFMAGSCSREEIDVLITYLETADDDQLLPSVREFRDRFPELRQLEEDAAARISARLNAAVKDDRELAGRSGFSEPDSRPGPNRKNGRSQRPGTNPETGTNPQTGTSRGPEAEPAGRKFRRLQTARMRAAAAALAVLAVSVVFYLSYPVFSAERYITGNAQIRNLELEDGSRVSLNANSELRVKLSEDVREVWLDGEAFFRVKHNAAKKFIVHTSGKVSVEVLGTEFNVKDRAEGTSVVLNKGSVRLKLRRGETPGELLMSPGEMAGYRPADDSLFKTRVDTSKYSSWKDNLLIFDETPLKQVGLTIENQFGYTVRFTSSGLAGLRFTGSNPADNLDMLLETLERSFGLSVTKRGDELIFSKPIE